MTDTKPYRIENATLRTSRPVYTKMWARFVNDFDGLALPAEGRVPLDFEHAHAEDLGFVENIRRSGSLLLGDVVLMRRERDGVFDRASDIVDRYEAGTPYGLSIKFGWRWDGEIEFDVYDDNARAITVNGETFDGPLNVIRKWPLLSVAVVRYGHDADAMLPPLAA